MLILTVWYGQKKGEKYILEQFSSGDMEIIHNILVNTGNLSIKNQNSTLEDNFNVDPLSLVGKFKASNIELQEQDVLKRGAFETTEEYKQRIADMDPIHIGCGILDAHRKDSYTDVNFLVHHIDHNPDIQFSPISAFYTIGVTETQIVDSELVAKLKVYKDKVCCDYSKVYLKNDSDLIAVHPIYWEKFFYETHAQYNKRISNMPLLPFGIGIPMSNKYDLKTGKLPVVINPFKYAEKILGNLLPEDMTIIIDCNRDMAKKICDSQIPCRLFLKLYTVEGVEKYVLWRKDIGEIVQANYCGITDWYKMVASWGSTQAMEKAERLEEIQENDCLRLGAAKGEAWAQNDLGNRYFYGDKVEQDYRQAAKWYRKAAEQGNVDAQYHLGICYNDGLGVKKDSLKALEWYRKAADQGNASAQYYLGICYYIGSGVEQDYRQAAEWYQKAANNGDADAQTHLGICYYTGQGVKQDWTKAVEWYQKAASQGNAWAQCNLGECYYDGDGVELDYQKAVEWFQKSADQEYMEAQNHLGECYYYGEGVKQNYQKAANWYRKAAEQGLAKAQTHLGECYYYGKGVQQDYQKAVNWYQKAADQCDAEAQNELGDCYCYGDGVEADDQKAVKWYLKAANQRYAWAQYNLGNCYSKGWGVEQDDRKAVEWYQKSANQGNTWAQYNLGLCYGYGKGIEPNYQKAVEWYQKAANNGHTDAQTQLGICYDIGKGIERDSKKAVEWFRKAANQGNAWAQYNLGFSYSHGDGVEQNWPKAALWFQKSADQGYARAQYNLGECYYNGCGVEKNYLKAVEWYQKAVEQGKNDLELQKDIRIALDRIQNPPQKKNSGCFITTAVCDSLNKSDDCYELTSFRRFRDNWLAAQVDGPVLIAEYYDVAPKIVESINMKDNRDEIYQQIWHDYLEPCLVMIEKGNYAACKNLYIKMVRNLQKEYAS